MKFSKEFKLTVLVITLGFSLFVFFKIGFIGSEQDLMTPANRSESGAITEGEADKYRVDKNTTLNSGGIKKEILPANNEESPQKEEFKKTVQGEKIIEPSPEARAEEKESGDSSKVNDQIPASDDSAVKDERPSNLIPSTLYVNDLKYETSLESESSAYDLMVSLKNQGKLNFSGENYIGIGFFLTEINGVKNNPKTGDFWIYYINHQPAQVGISSYVLKPGDVISWKYGKHEL